MEPTGTRENFQNLSVISENKCQQKAVNQVTGEGNGLESRQKAVEEKREEKLDFFKLKKGQLGLGQGNNAIRKQGPIS